MANKIVLAFSFLLSAGATAGLIYVVIKFKPVIYDFLGNEIVGGIAVINLFLMAVGLGISTGVVFWEWSDQKLRNRRN